MTSSSEPTAPIARIERAITHLGEEHVPSLGWEERVLVAAAARAPSRALPSLPRDRLVPRRDRDRRRDRLGGRPPMTLPLPIADIADADCMAVSGRMVRRGTAVVCLEVIHTRAVRVQMPDGSTEVVHPACLPRMR